MVSSGTSDWKIMTSTVQSTRVTDLKGILVTTGGRYHWKAVLENVRHPIKNQLLSQRPTISEQILQGLADFQPASHILASRDHFGKDEQSGEPPLALLFQELDERVGVGACNSPGNIVRLPSLMRTY